MSLDLKEIKAIPVSMSRAGQEFVCLPVEQRDELVAELERLQEFARMIATDMTRWMRSPPSTPRSRAMSDKTHPNDHVASWQEFVDCTVCRAHVIWKALEADSIGDYEAKAVEQVKLALAWDGPVHVAQVHLAAAQVFATLAALRTQRESDDA